MSDNKNEMDKLLNHDYDGIKEYDNPLPNWWLMTFFGAIIFGFIYWIHYEFGGGLSLAEEYKKDDTIKAYRNFYIKDKIGVKGLGWKKLNNTPEWIFIDNI